MKRFLISATIFVMGLLVGYQVGNKSSEGLLTLPLPGMQANQDDPIVELDLQKKDATYFDPRRLSVAPSQFNGQNIFLHGEAIDVKNVDGHTWIWLNAAVDDRGLEYVYVDLTPENLNVLGDDWYCIYGTPAGPLGFDRYNLIHTGSGQDTPVVQAYAIAPVDRGDEGFISVCDPSTAWFQDRELATTLPDDD